MNEYVFVAAHIVTGKVQTFTVNASTLLQAENYMAEHHADFEPVSVTKVY